MTSVYRPGEEDFKTGRARRGKAGALSLRHVSAPTSPQSRHAPQAIVKVAGWAHAPSSVRRMLDYIARIEDKEKRKLVALESEDGIQRQGKEEVDEIFQEWSEDFEREKKRGKSRLAVHIVLSAKADLTGRNIRKTLRAARRTVEEHFGEKGYKYALGVHQDGKSPHVHVVVKSVSRNKDVPKLRINPRDLLSVRETFAQELTLEGLKHVASRDPRKDKARHKMQGEKPNTVDKVKAVLKNLEKEQRQFERRMSREEPKVNAFQFRRQQEKALETMRSQVKEDKDLTGKQRMLAFNLVRRFRRGVEKKGIDEPREVRATLNHFEASVQNWTKDYELARKESKQPDLQAVLETGEKLQKKIEHFYSKDLRQTNLPAEDKKKAFRQLRQHELQIIKARELFKSRG